MFRVSPEELKTRRLGIRAALTPAQLAELRREDKWREEAAHRAEQEAQNDERRTREYEPWESPNLDVLMAGGEMATESRSLLISFRFDRARGHKTVIATATFLGWAGNRYPRSTDFALLSTVDGKPKLKLKLYDDEDEELWRPTMGYFRRNGGPLPKETLRHLTPIARAIYKERKRRKAAKSTA